jgi:hypothetical protein
MLDPGLLELKGARVETKYTTLATIKFLSGLMTQRSPFAGIDTRYGTRFMGGRPDALLAGSNCEISNKLTLQRRPGLVAYGTSSIPAPLTFYEWQSVKPFGLVLMVDTASAVYNYSTTHAGIYLDKATSAEQTNFLDLVDTLYMYDGVEAYKIVGPNLLTYSNTFTNAAWAKANAPLTAGQTDPLGGTAATKISWVFASSLSNVQQVVTPNYTPVPSNTFTFSVWLKVASGAESVTLEIIDQVNFVAVSSVKALTTSWVKYQVTGTMSSGLSTSGQQSLTVVITTPTATTPVYVYGAQLEVGGPATPTQLTTTKPQGVYLTGILAPVTAPTLSFSSVGSAWVHSHAYSLGNQIIDSNGNLQQVTTPGTSGGTAPVWATSQGSTTADGATLVWTMQAPSGFLSPKTGYQYYYAFLNSATGQPSNVSPVSAATGPLLGQSITVDGDGSTDPQVDEVAIYRNVDGGAFFYQLATVTNPGAGTWTYVDTVQDSGLNTSIYAPVGLLNTPPPTGALDPVFHSGRVWVHSGNNVYYSAGPDNAVSLNVILNAVSAESWPALNLVPFDAPVVRKLSTAAGLLVWTTSDIWIVTGSDLSSYSPTKIFSGHGLRSWNALDVEGSNLYMYLADRQFLMINLSTGSLEMGFPVGDVLETTFDPTEVYVARHIAGSQDNAIYFADGSTWWYRVNPNQVGASMSGEQTPLWSPKATVANGVGAIASVETTPGVFQLLVGQTSTGVVLVRDITVFEDNGASYTWDGTIGCVVLATAGTLAETESITTEMVAVGTTAKVEVLLDEISGTFEELKQKVNDPPQLVPSTSVYSNRFYLSQGPVPPLCRYLQIKLSGAANDTKDELLALSIRGVLVPEQV